jgi:hypothetical protein
MGQAGGTAAALAIASGQSPRDVDVTAIQDAIIAADGILEPPDADDATVGNPDW